MAAGDLKYYIAFMYDSDDDAPLGEDDVAIWYPGVPIEKVDWKSPKKTPRAKTYWLANNANPSGLITKKIPVHDVPFGFSVAPVDAVPFYLGLGKATADNPDTDQFKIQGSINGDVPALIAKKEDNNLLNEQACEVAPCKCSELSVFTTDGFLMTGLFFLGRRMYDMDNDSVLRTTVVPILRGKSYSVDDAINNRGPYKIMGNENISVTWNSRTLGNFLKNIGYKVTNSIKGYLLNDGNDYGVILNHGHRVYSDVALEFQVEPGGTNDLDDMDEYIDNSTSSDLVVKIPRNHANDYLQQTFKDAYLKAWDIAPAPEDEDALPTIKGIWHGITDIEVVDRQVTAGAATNPNNDADYEL